MQVKFVFLDFNMNRAQRGAEAAKIEVLEDDQSVGWFWMSKADLEKNIKKHGEHDALSHALSIYKRCS